MDTASPAGVRLRATAAPVTSATVKSEKEGENSNNKRDVHGEHVGESAHHPLLQAARIVGLALYFIGSCTCMNITQFIGAPVYFYDKEWYYAWMAMTKQHFGLLIVTMQQWWSPTTIRVSGDSSVAGQLIQAPDGRLECDFPERIVLIANHNIYTDWLYLWWVSYAARMHGHIFIILKESLKYVPVMGWGMQFFSFIFLSRNWTTDKDRFAHRLNKLKRKQGSEGQYNPMWMLIFPEGTNVSKNSRASSQAWAKKQNIPDMRHCILPRSTGLHFCLEQLDNTVEWVYDCTLAYEGIPRGVYGQDVYTLRSIYLEGHAPKSVNMYWRRFPVADIPMQQEPFEKWILDRWREKDDLLEYFMENNRFPASDTTVTQHKPIPNGAGVTRPVTDRSYIETSIKPSSPFEFLQIFVPSAAIMLLVHLTLRLWAWFLVAIGLRAKSW